MVEDGVAWLKEKGVGKAGAGSKVEVLDTRLVSTAEVKVVLDNEAISEIVDMTGTEDTGVNPAIESGIIVMTTLGPPGILIFVASSELLLSTADDPAESGEDTKGVLPRGSCGDMDG